MGRVVVYSDYVCPFCWLAWPAVRDAMREGVPLEPAAFELRPAPAPLPRALTAAQQAAWDREIAPRARALGLAPRVPTRFPRTRKAHEAVRHARASGLELELHDALFRAYFEEGRDIGRIDVLVEIGAGLGLDATGLKVELDIDQYTDAVRAEELDAARLGVTAVPAYVAAGEPARVHMGLLSAAELRDWLAQASGRDGDET